MTLLYQLGMLLVCFTMICLVLIYLALIAAVAWALLYHLRHGLSFLDSGRSRVNVRMIILIYGGPLFAGGTLLFLMLKPIFASPGAGAKGIELKESDQPLLFDFVRKICNTIHAPFPHTIQVDWQVNASASFRPGLSGILGGDLVLTLGLPLVTGLNVRQLAGVLAHEFGHFSQRGAMRLTFIAISINNWFGRAVYERDRVDDWLVASAEQVGGVGGAIIVYGTRGLVWFTRRILWVLMHIGRLVTFYMFRQMEFDADKYEARLVGSDTFEETARALQLMNLGFSATLDDIGLAWKERRLGDDLPGMIAARTAQLPRSVRAKAESALQEDKTQWFATHPSDCARIRKARKEQARGVFRLEEPANILFENYPVLAADCSVTFYHAMLGEELNGGQLVSSEALEQGQQLVARELEVTDSFFFGLWPPARPLTLTSRVLNAPEDTPTAVASLSATRERILQLLPEAREFSRRNERARTRYYTGVAATSLLDAGFRLAKGAFELPSNEPDSVRRFAADAVKRLASSDLDLEPMAGVVRARLLGALELLHDPETLSRMGEKQVAPDGVVPLLRAVVVMGAELPAINELRLNLLRFENLYANLDSKRPDQKLTEDLLCMCRDMRRTCRTLNTVLGCYPYPLDHSDSHESIGNHLTGNMELVSEEAAVNKASEVIENFELLYGRILGRLGLIAEQAETAAGLEPLVVPK